MYCAGPLPEFLVTSLLMGQVCLLSRNRSEESVHPWALLKIGKGAVGKMILETTGSKVVQGTVQT